EALRSKTGLLDLAGITTATATATVPGAIEIDSVDWTETGASPAAAGGSGVPGAATLGDLTITKPVDATSAALFKALVGGVVFTSGKLTLLDGTGSAYATYALRILQITEIKPVTEHGESYEQVTLHVTGAGKPGDTIFPVLSFPSTTDPTATTPTTTTPPADASAGTFKVTGSPATSGITGASWDATAVPATAAGAGGTRVTIGDLVVTSTVDARTPLLRSALEGSKLLPVVQVVVQASPSAPTTVYDMANVRVSRLSLHGAGSAIETVAFAPTSVKITTTPVGGSPTSASYDTKTKAG
ncbi:MAG: type VI secretion system tube protein Hcp, partial [Solirubrobacteraceae bacterium]